MNENVINVLISTYGSRVKNAIYITRKKYKDVNYFISHQEYNGWGSIVEYAHSEFKYIKCEGKGLSKNRNNLLRNVFSGIAVIADDDVSYKDRYFSVIKECMNSPKVDIGCFKIETHLGEPDYKKYPDKKFRITNLDNYTPSSIEIVFKVNAIKENKIMFDERFGIGAFFYAGEEKQFLQEAIDKGLNLWYFPKYIVSHPYESTGKKIKRYSAKKAKYLGANNYIRFGYFGIFRVLLSPIKNFFKIRKDGGSPFLFFFNSLIGFLYLAFTKKKT